MHHDKGRQTSDSRDELQQLLIYRDENQVIMQEKLFNLRPETKQQTVIHDTLRKKCRMICINFEKFFCCPWSIFRLFSIYFF